MELYFPIEYQKTITDTLLNTIRKYPDKLDLEKAVNNLIQHWKLKYDLTTAKPLFPKNNLGVLLGDPFFNFY